MALKKLGYIGWVNDKPFFEDTTDNYVANGQRPISVVDVYKSKKEAKKRFEDIREVFVEDDNGGCNGL